MRQWFQYLPDPDPDLRRRHLCPPLLQIFGQIVLRCTGLKPLHSLLPGPSPGPGPGLAPFGRPEK